MNKDKIRTFTFHGFELHGQTGNQYYGNCPFYDCGGRDKFYVNKENLCWDCKKCGRKGNKYGFLHEITKRNAQQFNQKIAKKLCASRKLPYSAFKPWEMGVYGNLFTFPIRNEKGTIIDIRRYNLKERGVRGTAGCGVGIFNLHNLVNVGLDTQIFLCEGEWDGMAMQWLINTLKLPALAVAVPGASTFKREWIPFFEQRDVLVCYDNDEAGDKGELVVKERIESVVKSIRYLYWPDKLPQGFDLRDFIAIEAVKNKKPRKAYKAITEMFEPIPRKILRSEKSGKESIGKKVKPVKYTLKALINAYRRWLCLKDSTCIELMMAVVLSNRIQGDPLWMFLVAPPGGCKTELMTSLSKHTETYFVSSLSGKSLISGAHVKGGDPSLVPLLNGKVLCIKDYTTILDMKEQDREEIFSIFRDAYDGYCSKQFGTGVKRAYHSRFSIISAVTPAIYELDARHNALGERFLKYCISDNMNGELEDEIIMKAISNVSHEPKLRDDISQAAIKFLNWRFYCMEKKKKFDVPIPDDLAYKIMNLGKFGSVMRGNVSRDKYRNDIIHNRPYKEVGTRLSKQLAKLCKALAIVRAKEAVTEDEYRIVKKVMLDTISQRNEDIVRRIYFEAPTVHDSLRPSEISQHTRYTRTTINRVLADLDLLQVVSRIGSVHRSQWTLSEYIRDLIRKADLYTTNIEAERKAIDKIKYKQIRAIRSDRKRPIFVNSD